MSPFYERFPELAEKETRTALIPLESGGLPVGEYNFFELYCDEVGCDCRRVLITVYNPDTGEKVWATINYGWETEAYYRKWSRAPELAEGIAEATLDPVCSQTEHAPVFLEIFKQFVADLAYVERLKRHYRTFKDAIEMEAETRRRWREHSNRTRNVK
jgi:hypothetical protein